MQANPQQPAQVFDPGGLAKAIGDAFQSVIQGWSNGLPDQAATQGTGQLRGLWSWMNTQGMDFVVHTPVGLVSTAGAIGGVTSVRPLLEAVVTISILLGAVSYAGHHWLGWPGLSDTVSRIILTIILTGSCFRLMIFSMDTLNQMVTGVTATLPTMPNVDTGNAVVTFALLAVWVGLALRLVIVMGKRIVWLAVLFQLAPVAMTTMGHSKSAWIASTWARLWIGWLAGQLIAVMVFLVCVAMTKLGGPGGYILSVAGLLVAYDAVHILSPSSGGMSVSVGVGPIRLRI